MKDFLSFVVIPFVLFVSIFVAIDNLLEANACHNYKFVTGKDTKYLFLDDCYIKADSGWQRWDEYKIRAAASEGLKK